MLTQANAEVQAAQQALLAENARRELEVENQRLRQQHADQEAAHQEHVRHQEQQTAEFRKFVVDFQNSIQQK